MRRLSKQFQRYLWEIRFDFALQCLIFSKISLCRILREIKSMIPSRKYHIPEVRLFSVQKDSQDENIYFFSKVCNFAFLSCRGTMRFLTTFRVKHNLDWKVSGKESICDAVTPQCAFAATVSEYPLVWKTFILDRVPLFHLSEVVPYIIEQYALFCCVLRHLRFILCCRHLAVVCSVSFHCGMVSAELRKGENIAFRCNSCRKSALNSANCRHVDIRYCIVLLNRFGTSHCRYSQCTDLWYGSVGPARLLEW